MSREWKPGDVAMVLCSDGEWRRAGYFDATIFVAPVWVFEDNSRRRVDDSAARPLVVIDPEDHEAVARLAALLWPHYDDASMAHLRKSEVTADALREFANPTPPKPEEPMGLGAVVEDAEGCTFVRTNVAGWEWHEADGGPTSWNCIDAVKVLSEGVTP